MSPSLHDSTNEIFALAAEFVNNTRRSIFLTGKAGTGKTTFLKFIRQTTDKKTAVVAPTGVAAINAGGMTMHSFFQLPLGLYVPGHNSYHGNVQITNRHTLFKNLRLSESKRELLQELELLIIDEVSMVRCDMLDATDAILRSVRRSNESFGGVQVLFIGDLFQLPPVAINQEWAILNDYYDSPFFFHSNVVRQMQPLYIELQKIYRQNEQEYIDLLNAVRHSQVTPAVIERLNSRYTTDAAQFKDCITLTTHNYKADAINRDELKKLPGDVFHYDAILDGDFADKSYPADVSLSLKVGARVMFIRNDTDDERAYYNGKLATVVELNDDKVRVQFEDTGGIYQLKHETWRNIRYQYNKEEDRLEEDELGSFSQFPIRLAWAITIHKSQGLTFDKAVIDASESFAPGQVYVALSRCTSLNGLVLRSKLSAEQITTDERVVDHARQLASMKGLDSVLSSEKVIFEQHRLVSLFDVERIRTALQKWHDELPGKKLPDVDAAIALAGSVISKLDELIEVSRKFRKQLEDLLVQARTSGNYEAVDERAAKAVKYFDDFLHTEIFQKLKAHVDELKGKAKVKKYVATVRELALAISKKGERIRGARLGNRQYFESTVKRETTIEAPSTKVKKEKGQSARESLELFLAGNSPEQVAQLRGLAKTTIEGHLAEFVLSGEIAIENLVSPEKIKAIEDAMAGEGGNAMGAVKQKLGDTFSYGEIRAVIYHKERTKANESEG